MKKRLYTVLALSLTLSACSNQKEAVENISKESLQKKEDSQLGVATQNECDVFKNNDFVVTRVDYQTEEDRVDLTTTFEPIGGGKGLGYLLFDISKTDFERLRVTGITRGWKVSIDHNATQTLSGRSHRHGEHSHDHHGHELETQGIGQGFSCYRTVEETYQAARDLVKSHPNLVSWTPIGSTWLKTQRRGGYNMYVLKITNKNTRGTKPKTLLTTAIHGREYTTAELGTRFAEYLVGNYGKDPDVTWILDNQEVHFILQANPDGRKEAEKGVMWRKNANDDRPCRRSGTDGVDLNRNFSFMWGEAGASYNPCSDSYMGSFASSEPEVKAIQNYLRSIFPDKRGPRVSDAAPEDTAGMYLDIHSFSELVMWPWGHTRTPSSNAAAFESLGKKLASFNNYTPKPAVGLYPSSGNTIDFGYGELGVASFAYELGRRFFEDCNSFTRTILPDNIASLMYALKVSRAPYKMAKGPDLKRVSSRIDSTGQVTLSAEVKTLGRQRSDSRELAAQDAQSNTQNATTTEQLSAQWNWPGWPPRPNPTPTRPIGGQGPISVEYFVDTPPWAGGKATSMKVANNKASTILPKLSRGQHTIYVRATDKQGNYGPVSAVFVGK